MNQFKIGDKVRIDPNKVDELRYGSNGIIGNEYVIEDVSGPEEADDIPYRLSGSNWHSGDCLTLVTYKSVMGGELL